MISSSHYTITKSNRNFLLTSVWISAFFFALGIFATVIIGSKVDENERERLLIRAKNAAILIEPSDVKALSGSEADLENPTYQKLKDQISELKSANPDANFTYLMGLNGEKLFFFVDSESPGTEDYSAPGDVYEETLPIEVENFKKGLAFVEGPYSDKWGDWVSAYAPIIDSESRETLAIIGIDVDALYWSNKILSVRLIVGFVTLLMCAFLIVLMLYLKNSVGNIELLHKDNESLRASQEYLLETEGIVHLGRWNLNISSNELAWNDQMFSIFEVDQNSKIVPDTFWNSIHPEDLQEVKIAFNKAIAGQLDSFDILYRILISGTKSKKILSICSVRKTSRGEVFRIIGTAQDMSKFSITRT